MEEACLAKFRQNLSLAKRLVGTGGWLLAEARLADGFRLAAGLLWPVCSPWDKFWGIGLGSSHPDAIRMHYWPGQNRLGLLLQRVREQVALELKNLRLPA